MAFIGNRIKEFARLKPDATALVCGRTSLTWRELADQTQKVENYLINTVADDARVALILNNPVSLLVCFFACARSGRVAMLMSPDWPAAQTSAVLGATRPEHQIEDTLFEALLAGSDPAAAELQPLGPPPGEDTLFYAGFTSGSTGLPKGYVRSHGSWLESFLISDKEVDPELIDRIVLPGKLSHSLHLYAAVHGLDRGIEVVVAPRFDPRTILDELAAAKYGSALYATPTHLKLIAEAAQSRDAISIVRLVFSSGAKWQEADHKALHNVFPNAQLIEFYGASETSFISWSRQDNTVPCGSVGRPADGVQVVIGDPDRPEPTGSSGLIWVKSPLLFSGYICGETPDTEWRNGWLAFGDYGYLDKNGFLFLIGRETRMIVTSGLNVFPEEVERALMQHPSVRCAVAFGRSDPLRGERLEAVVQLTASLANAERALQQHCTTLLGKPKSPRKLHVRDEIPLTPGGKPDIQRVLAELSASNQETL
ncbi:MAG: AMP-binding protein [Roseibium sp.]